MMRLRARKNTRDTKWRRANAIVASFLVLLSLTMALGCGSAAIRLNTDATPVESLAASDLRPIPIIDESNALLAKVRSLAARQTPPTDAPEFVLCAGDVVDLVVSDQPEFSGVVTVSADGTVSLPTTGDIVRAAGLNPRAFAAEIAGAVSPRYVKKPPEVLAVVRRSLRPERSASHVNSTASAMPGSDIGLVISSMREEDSR